MLKNALYKYGKFIPKAQKGIELGINTPGIGNEDRSTIEMVAFDDINLILYQYQNPTLGLSEKELDKILVDYLNNYGEYLVSDDVKLSDYVDGLPVSSDRLAKIKSSLPTKVQKATLNTSTDDVIEEYYSLDRINDNVYKVENLPNDKIRITNMATGKVDFSGDLDAYRDQSNVRLGDVIEGGKKEAEAILQGSNKNTNLTTNPGDSKIYYNENDGTATIIYYNNDGTPKEIKAFDNTGELVAEMDPNDPEFDDFKNEALNQKELTMSEWESTLKGQPNNTTNKSTNATIDPTEWENLTPEEKEQVILQNYQPSNDLSNDNIKTFYDEENGKYYNIEYNPDGSVNRKYDLPNNYSPSEFILPVMFPPIHLSEWMDPRPEPAPTPDPNADWLRQTANFERNFGSAKGTGLSKYTDDYTINRFNTVELPQLRSMIPGYDQLPENQRAQIGDYFFNTGRDPRVMLLHSDGLISDSERTALHSGTEEQKKAIEEGNLTKEELDKILKDNIEKAWNNLGDQVTYDPDKIYVAKDAIYKNTETIDGKPNPAYKNSWLLRNEMLDGYNIGPKSPRLLAGQYDPDKQSRQENFLSELYGKQPVRNAILEAGANRTIDAVDKNEIVIEDEDEDDNDVNNKGIIAPPTNFQYPYATEKTLVPGTENVYRERKVDPSGLSYKIPSYYKNQPQIELEQQPIRSGQLDVINTGKNVLNRMGKGVNQVIDKAQEKIQNVKDKRKARRDAYNELYNKELQGIETAKGLIDDSKQFNKELNESNRLEDKRRRLTLESNKKRNKYEKNKELSEIDNVIKESDTQIKLRIQNLKSEKKRVKEETRKNRKAEKKRERQVKKEQKLRQWFKEQGMDPDVQMGQDNLEEYKHGGNLMKEEDFDFYADVDNKRIFKYLRGGNLPKAQNSLDVTETFFNPAGLLEQGYTAPSLIDETVYDPSSFENFNEKMKLQTALGFGKAYEVPTYTIETPNQFESRYDDILGSDKKLLQRYDVGLNKKLKPESPYGDYNPWRVYEPSNIMQLAGQDAVLGYNTMMGLKRAATPKIHYTEPIIKKQSITPNYLAANEAIARISDSVRESSRSPQQMIANLVNAEMQGAKQKSQIAADTQAKNLQLEQQYYDRLNQQKAMKDQLYRQAEAQRLANEVTKQQFQKTAVENVEKKLQSIGVALGKEKADRIKLNNYLNQIAADYEYKVDANGMPYIVHKPTGASMTMEAYQATLKKKAEDMAKTRHSSVLEEEGEKSATERAKEANKVKGKKQYGGYYTPKKKYKKVKNRLYM